MARRAVKTSRRNFRIPAPGAVFTLDDVALITDCPPALVRAAAASGALRTTHVSGIEIVDGPDVVEWVKRLDAELSSAA